MIRRFMPSGAERSELERVLEEHADQRFAVIEPGGNHGDHLIYRGLERTLDGLGVAYESVNYLDLLRSSFTRKARKGVNLLFEPTGLVPFEELPLGDPDVVLIHGGGNFSDIWGGSMAVFKNVVAKYPDTPIVVGPQTYWFTTTDFGELVDGTSQRIRMFCREEYSYALLNNYTLPENVTVHRSPDTAFYLDGEYLRDYLTDDLGGRDVGGHDLVAFRDDRESIVPRHEQERVATESENPHVEDVSDKSLTSFEQFVTLTERADTVYTDRLHVSILGTLLGNDVEMYENRYYKNRGVYKYSLSGMSKTRFNDAV
ncbi:MAG: polysaccharide pyruvyl transferase family protein [Haloarculaceae archaeon]